MKMDEYTQIIKVIPNYAQVPMLFSYLFNNLWLQSVYIWKNH